MNLAIQVSQLSKKYRVGPRKRMGSQTFREAISGTIALPWHALRNYASNATRGRTKPLRDTSPDVFWALKDISFDVKPGEVVGIIGRNGAGKSTLLKILSRITDPDTGWAKLHGRLGSLLEVGTGFHSELTGRENTYLYGAILGMTRKEVARKFDEIVAFAEIDRFLDTPVKHYSSGMYVRLAFAVAAHLEPEILILDEVLAVGDNAFQEKCLTKLKQIIQAGGTILLVSHNMATVKNFCRKAIFLSQGRIELVGESAEVVNAYLSCASPVGRDRLKLSTCRSAGMLPIIQEISLQNAEGQPCDHLPAGSELNIKIHYDSPVALPEAIFGIMVETNAGEPLFWLHTPSQYGSIPSLPQRGLAHCRVPSLPLAPGTYLLSFYCSTTFTKGNLDFLKSPLSIDVEKADFFGTGRLPPPWSGCFLVPATWSFVLA